MVTAYTAKLDTDTLFMGRNVEKADHILRDLTSGSSLHGLTDGSWGFSDAIMGILRIVGSSDVVVSTWTMGRSEIDLTERQLHSGLFRTFRLMVDRSFRSRQPEYCSQVRTLFGDDAVRVWSSHAKFAIFTGGTFDVLYLTSANLNRNRRVENYSVFAGGALPTEYLALADDLFVIQKPGQGFDDSKAGREHTDMVQGKTPKASTRPPKDDGPKQHVDMYRKIMLRKRLLRRALPGAAYVPFIGDGDIAADLYADRVVYGADLDSQRAVTAAGRLNGSTVIAADCDSWPFAGPHHRHALCRRRLRCLRLPVCQLPRMVGVRRAAC